MTLDPKTLAAIRAKAREEAAQAPPLTPEQRAAIKALFAGPAHRPARSSEAVVRRD